MTAIAMSRGFGDSIARLTSFLGITPCGGCERRREFLNRWIPYRQSATDSHGARPRRLSRPAETGLILPTPRTLEIVQAPVLMANEGGWRAPERRSGPAEWEGSRRQGRSGSSQPSPTPSSGAPASFACGINVTESTKSAIRTAKNSFYHWSNSQRHEACQALSSLTAGDVAWDILELHAQVTSDVLNQPFRPTCATSGATPACGSSVSIGGSCHFAGSANYVIFGVMCRLCFDHYTESLDSASWYELIDKDTYRMGILQFGVEGMLGLIDLYKKYVPLLTGDAPAGNIDAAKRWSIAGWHGWPNRAKTPPPDRVNCTMTCPESASLPFTVSWYPLLNPYARRRGILS